jgi:Type I phosphodiesterase / nucleotide pyrophosphatase
MYGSRIEGLEQFQEERMRRFVSFSLLAFFIANPRLYTAPHGVEVRRVLLIAVDGLHALDVSRYIKNHPDSALAELARHGITYTNARTPANSDSFPGLLALVTGGSPLSHGLFYDVSYDRSIFDPTNKSCSPPAGNPMIFDESIDLYDANNVSQNVINPEALPRHRVNGNCLPLFPHEALRTNTIFEVVKAAGGRTAWADKHPAYDLVNGPSGKGVDDLFTPEITNVGGFDATVSVVCTVRNDDLKSPSYPERNSRQDPRRHAARRHTDGVWYELSGGERRSEARYG